MTNKIIVTRRRTPLAVIEILITSIGLSTWLSRKYHWDWVTGVLLFLGTAALISFLFFRIRIFRYIISILFSLIWALFAYTFISGFTKSTVISWIATGVVFVICLVAHKSYFAFERDAIRVDYRER